LEAAQLRKTKERDAIKLEDMHGDPEGRKKLAYLKVFAYEVRCGISDEAFDGPSWRQCKRRGLSGNDSPLCLATRT
jgi:hypothetical protein